MELGIFLVCLAASLAGIYMVLGSADQQRRRAVRREHALLEALSRSTDETERAQLQKKLTPHRLRYRNGEELRRGDRWSS